MQLRPSFAGRAAAIALLATGILIPAAAHAADIKVDPRATYLRTNNDPGALDAPAIELDAYDLQPGDVIRLERLGDFQRGVNFQDDALPLFGVFSSTDTLLTPDNQYRLPDAIDAGTDAATLPTNSGQLSTDIDEDFRIANANGGNGLILTIPDGAEYLFVTPNDSRFTDNTDPDGDYGLRITLLDTDRDRDGVLDSQDHCLGSDMRPWVDTGSGPTTVENTVDEHGCTLQDYINEIAVGAKNHGHYVNGIKALADALEDAGVITHRQRQELVTGAARSSGGKR